MGVEFEFSRQEKRLLRLLAAHAKARSLIIGISMFFGVAGALMIWYAFSHGDDAHTMMGLYVVTICFVAFVANTKLVAIHRLIVHMREINQTSSVNDGQGGRCNNHVS